MAHAFDFVGAVDLGKKGRQGIFAADLVALGLDEIEPLSVVDVPIGAPLSLENLHCHFSETLAA